MGTQHSVSEAEMGEGAETQARPMLPAPTKLKEAGRSPLVILEQGA